MMSSCCGTYPYYQYPYYGFGYSQPYTYCSPYQYVNLSYGLPYGYPYMYDWGCSYYGLPFGYAYSGPAVGVAAPAELPRTRGEYKVGNCLMICQ
jgi:hypothetical protein